MALAASPSAALCRLLGTRYPIVQAGMVWVSGGRLAAAAAEAGCLGLIGAGSMTPDLLRDHIRKARSLTRGPIGVNVPLLYSRAPDQLDVALSENVRVFVTSAGSPGIHTDRLKSAGAVVLHVTSSPALAAKCQAAGVDAVVAEGFEAGGHNGRDETTTLVLVRAVVGAVQVPVIAAGGIGDGYAIAAALALGAAGVQIGTRFAATVESSAHPAYKRALVEAGAGSTVLALKKHVPVRMIRNAFYDQVAALEDGGASVEQLRALLGKGRARRGILEGDLDEGELEAGQVAGLVHDLPTCGDLVDRLATEYEEAVRALPPRLAGPPPAGD